MQTQPYSVPSLTIGGLIMPLAGLKIIRSAMNGGGARASFVDVSLGLTTRATYVVPAAKTFVPYAIKILTAYSGAGTQYVYLSYCDNDVGINGAATAQTNPIGMFSGTAGGTNFADAIGWVASLGTVVEVAQGGSVPTGKYPALSLAAGSATSNIWIYGYEV